MVTSPITHVRYVAHAVPDFAAGLAFYSGIWGLTTVAQDGDLAFLAAEGSPEPYVLRLRQSAEKHLDLMSLAVHSSVEVDQLAATLGRAGVRIEREPERLDIPGGGYGLRFFDPDGRLVEISADVMPREARSLDVGESIPGKLTHIVINSPDIDRTVAFYTQHSGSPSPTGSVTSCASCGWGSTTMSWPSPGPRTPRSTTWPSTCAVSTSTSRAPEG